MPGLFGWLNGGVAVILVVVVVVVIVVFGCCSASRIQRVKEIEKRCLSK